MENILITKHMTRDEIVNSNSQSSSTSKVLFSCDQKVVRLRSRKFIKHSTEILSLRYRGESGLYYYAHEFRKRLFLFRWCTRHHQC